MRQNLRVIMIALNVYSSTGGIQGFNRRVASNFNHIKLKGEAVDFVLHSVGDEKRVLAPTAANKFKAFGGNALLFIIETITRSINYDIMFVGHINLLPVAVLAKIVNPRLKLVLFAHGDEVWNCQLRPKRFYEPVMLKLVARVAAVSTFTIGEMSREFKLKLRKFSIFPNAVDSVQDVPLATRCCKTVLCVTRLGTDDKLKNVDVLIRAVDMIKRSGMPVILNVVGDGELRPLLERLVIELAASEHVRFLGRLSDKELALAYEEAALFALPSSKEGFGIVYLEAWQHKLAVVCGMRGAPRQIVSDGVDGVVVDELNDQDVADKISYLLKNPKIAAWMGENGRKKVEENYLNGTAIINLENMVSQVSDESHWCLRLLVGKHRISVKREIEM